MGEISDMILDGTLCQECQCLVEGMEYAGHPRYCLECGGDPECNGAVKKTKAGVKCWSCGRRFKTAEAMQDHYAAKHVKGE